jgi:cation/acetate symporter
MGSLPVILFVAFVGFVLGLSFYLARKASSASGYFAAGGNIHWFVNGIAFAGDYLSAASFLGICGLIATLGYDGFLYSIGYLAGWIVAMFVVAEPMKRLGRYTFTDALDSTFNSRGIQLAAGISTMVVSIFYLIPQMVGAGVLVTPLLGLPHAVGVMMVGAIVILIVATAGMKSTTYVQFLKGGLLIVFSAILVGAVCVRGLTTRPTQGGKVPYHEYRVMPAERADGRLVPGDATHTPVARQEIRGQSYVKMAKRRELIRAADGVWGFALRGNTIRLPGLTAELDRLLEQAPGETRSLAGLTFARTETGLTATTEAWWKEVVRPDGGLELHELASVARKADGTSLLNGLPATPSQQLQVGNLARIAGQTGEVAATGSVDPVKLIALLGDPDTVVRRWKQEASFTDGGFAVTVFAPVLTPGNRIMRPGLYFKVEGTPLQRLDFVSLMLALFLGTAALPHILIRYYTVPSPSAARKSTIVAISAIGLFYILTLFMGLGAMVSGVLDPADSNMAAPLLARSFGGILFAFISAIAFATVLGTVSGLIVAASGAVAHDLLDRYCDLGFNERQKVVIGKAAAFTVGLVAIILGIVFKGMNVSYLVGWAFAVAASANLPAILMLLFWKRTTAAGIVASIIVGIVSAVGLILLSPDMYVRYGLPPDHALIQLNQPAVVSVPLSFLALVVVSLLTRRSGPAAAAAPVRA